mgnify:CR=1 FL=1
MRLFKKYRIDNGLSQVEISEDCGLTQAMWSQLENGERTNITIDTIHRIINGTDITFEEIYREYRRGLRVRTKTPIGSHSRTRVTNRRRKREA